MGSVTDLRKGNGVDEIDKAVASAAEVPQVPMAQYQIAVAPGRFVVYAFPVDIGDDEVLALFDGILHTIVEHRQRMAAANPASRIIVPAGSIS